MLSTLSLIYSKLIDARNALYENGVLKSHSFNIPVISVGNITIGGTGKTPLVAYVANVLAERSERVCVISRGYRRENEKQHVLVSDSKKILSNFKTAGDEPIELAKKLLGKAIVIADANRARAGRRAIEEFGATTLVLDDGFQHIKINRDLDIITIDGTNPFGNQKTLPSGILREPIKNLRRSDLVIVTRANLVKNTNNLKKMIKFLHPDCEVFIAKNKTSKIISLKHYLDDSVSINISGSDILEKPSLAFCALGNPNNFFDQLIDNGFNISAEKSFRDHHFYNQKDIRELEKSAIESSCEILLTTAKDAVKLEEIKFEFPVFIIESTLSFDQEKKLRGMIHAVFSK